MAEVENLEIIIDVIDSYSDEINQLIAKLAELEGTVRAVDDITLDVDVRGSGQLNTLMAQMAALQSMDAALGDVNVGVDGDTLSRTGGAAAAEGAQSASEASELLSLTMADLHNAIARLIPLILVFIGAIPAVIGGIVALGVAAFSAAAALAALTALGAVGLAAQLGDGDIMAGLREIINQIQSDLSDTFMPLAQRLAPLFEDALDGLGRLFQQIANRGDVLVSLTDQARAFGGFMLDTLPSVIADMGRMVEAFDDLFGLIASGASNINVFSGLTSFMAQAADELVLMTALFVDMIPPLFRLSIGFLAVANVIGLMVAGIGKLLSVLPVTSEQFGILVGTLFAAYTAALLFTKVLGSSTIAALVGAFQSVVAYIAGLSSYIGTVGAATIATLAFASALALATFGISAVVGGISTMGSQFAGLGTNIDAATKSLKRFDSVQSGLSGGANPYANPNVSRGQPMGQSRFANQSVTVNVEGNADEDMVREQTRNAMYELERTRRKR